jgi:hypothetical protein
MVDISPGCNRVKKARDTPSAKPNVQVLPEMKRDRTSLQCLHTPSKSFRTKGGVRGDVEVKSIPRICKSSYGEKLLSNNFVSIYLNFIGFRANIQYMIGCWKYKFMFTGP